MAPTLDKLLDIVVDKRLDTLEENLGFSSAIFMLFGLPTKKLIGNPRDWEKKTSICELTITRDKNYEIPYGCYARMNQIFIDTEVKTKDTNIINLGSSFNEYVKKIGYKEGKANKALLKQLINYVTSTITLTPINLNPDRFIGVKSLISKAWNVHFDVDNPAQLMLKKGQIILDEDYANFIKKHAVPVDMHIIKLFKRNPLALDFYRYLAYRNNELTSERSFPDKLLFEQLGTEDTNRRRNRIRLKQILKMIQLYWPIQARFEDNYFIIKPSPPAIQKKLTQ